MAKRNKQRQAALNRENLAESEAPSLDDLLQGNQEYQTAFDQKVNQALLSAHTKWEQERTREPDEGERMEEIRAREQENIQLTREREALEQEKAAFAHQRMEIAVGQELQKRGLPAAFAPWLAGDTPEESAEHIDTFEVLFQEAISAAVTSRMRGTGAPREPASPKGYSREEIRSMSRREINAHWAEVQTALKGGC